MTKNYVLLISLSILYAVSASSARAECSSGFLANTLCEAGVIDEKTAQDADAAHKAVGRPLDKMGADAADEVVPGSGTAWEAQDEARREQERLEQLQDVGPPVFQ